MRRSRSRKQRESECARIKIIMVLSRNERIRHGKCEYEVNNRNEHRKGVKLRRAPTSIYTYETETRFYTNPFKVFD